MTTAAGKVKIQGYVSATTRRAVVGSLGPAESLSDFMERAFLAEVKRRGGSVAAEPIPAYETKAGPKLPRGRRPKLVVGTTPAKTSSATGDPGPRLPGGRRPKP